MSRRNRRERKRRRAEEAAAAEKAARRGPGVAEALASRAGELVRTRWFPPAALAALTLAVWARTFAVPVIGWDDDTYLFRDERLAKVSAGNLWRIATEPFFANYHPVTTLTYAFDRAVYGRWAPGFHATQLAFYVAGVLLLYYLFRALLGSAGAALAAAAIYSVHAIHVEPVAWLAQRKDVVCLAFYAGAILAYVRYERATENRWRLYAAAIALSALAMLSKGYAVVLPGVFVAYDLCFGERREGEALRGVGWRRVWDKLPFVALALAVTAFTILSQGKDSALTGESLGFVLRMKALLHVFAAYVSRGLLPVRLCAKYALNSGNVSSGLALLGLLFALAHAAGFVLLRRRLPAAAFGIALFVLPLATVMNTFWTLRIWMTDRYLFFPTMGSSLALAAGGMALWRAGGSGPRVRGAVAAGAAATTVLYAALAVARIGVWTDPVLLWSDTLRKQMGLGGSGPVTFARLREASWRTGGSLTIGDREAYGALAAAYRRAGNEAEADKLVGVFDGKAAVGDSGIALSLAERMIKEGRYDEAIEILRPIVEGGTWLAPIALKVTGDALSRKGDVDGARAAYGRALELYRASGQTGTEAMLGLGTLEFKGARYAEAASWYRRALGASPDDAFAAFNLGMALCETGQAEEGYALYEKALARAREDPAGSPALADVHKMMAKAACERLGRPADAVRHFEEVLRLVPDHPERAAMEYLIGQQRALMRRAE